MNSANTTILLIEDDEGLRLTISDRLAAEGYAVETASDGVSGADAVQKLHPHLVLLDVMLPRKNGFDVCRDIRQSGLRTPILMLTARGQVTDKVVGLKLGADDYLTKPFDMMELLARVEALLRRSSESGAVSTQALVRIGNVDVDFRAMEVRRGETALELSAREFQLLHYLVEHRGKSLSREELLNEVWGYDSMPTTRTVDTHIAWLRQKLEPNPRYPQFILTVHGVGYKFAG